MRVRGHEGFLGFEMVDACLNCDKRGVDPC